MLIDQDSMDKVLETIENASVRFPRTNPTAMSRDMVPVTHADLERVVQRIRNLESRVAELEFNSYMSQPKVSID